jgi:putative ABC transport system permease protein
MNAYLFENINMATKTLFSNKLRSGLTMLGVIIGNASVIAMVAVGQGGQKYINQQFESLGTNILFVSPGVDQRGPQQYLCPLYQTKAQRYSYPACHSAV